MKNKEIDSLLEREKQTIDKHLKVLLLGESDSGKSTILKIIKDCKGDSLVGDTELLQYKSKIYRDTFNGIKHLLNWEEHSEIINNLFDQLKSGISKIKSAEIEIIDEYYGQLIENVWKDTGIKQLMIKTNKINVTSDTLPYFLDNIQRISKSDFIPTTSDIKNTYFRTIGIHENHIKIQNIDINFYELGGSIVNSPKKSWTPYFDNVTAILYCVSLNEFDKYRDTSTNCMLESLKTFDEIVNKTFPNSHIILYFTKSELFKEKISSGTGNLSKTFPDYNGGNDYNAALSFISSKFLKSPPSKRNIYKSISKLNDETNILTFTFESLKDIVNTTTISLLDDKNKKN